MNRKDFLETDILILEKIFSTLTKKEDFYVDVKAKDSDLYCNCGCKRIKKGSILRNKKLPCGTSIKIKIPRLMCNNKDCSNFKKKVCLKPFFFEENHSTICIIPFIIFYYLQQYNLVDKSINVIQKYYKNIFLFFKSINIQNSVDSRNIKRWFNNKDIKAKVELFIYSLNAILDIINNDNCKKIKKYLLKINLNPNPDCYKKLSKKYKDFFNFFCVVAKGHTLVRNRET